jgi:hypothetical protein
MKIIRKSDKEGMDVGGCVVDIVPQDKITQRKQITHCHGLLKLIPLLFSTFIALFCNV